ncbi:MAG: hypothetical protein E6L03_06170 [Thaumarchaeota archaeon]|nr:MAG: hypothetical protein E6L03_06170 [Nitrososphaerota archaeon]
MANTIFTALTIVAILSISAAVIFTNQVNAHQQNGYIAILNGRNAVPSHPDVSATGITGLIVK